jgi:acetyltransferase-like isoleucine patch superfamily enzyme
MKGPIKDTFIRGVTQRCLQLLARFIPGGENIRVMLHRARGVHIGKDVFISQDVILETAYPDLITLEDRAWIGMRTTIIAHFREMSSGVRIESDAFVGPGVIILPNVTIGRGAVVAAGSVVTRSVPPMTFVQGNPAAPVARCGTPLTPDVTLKEFSRRLEPYRARQLNPKQQGEKPTQAGPKGPADPL